LNFSIKSNHPFNYHLLIAFICGFWITLFLVFVGPFDTATLSLDWRAKVMGGYGMIFILCYLLSIPFQNRVYTKAENLSIGKEVLVFGVIFTINPLVSFLYYQSETINGDYGFYKFLLEIYFPSLLIFLPLLAVLRWVFFRSSNQIKSANKKLNELSDLEGWKAKIQQLMEEKVYLDPTLTLHKMAQLLGANPAVLSQAINQGYGLNFNDFINQYRIEAVVECLKNGEHKILTITGISENCGFKSRATFNRAFKKHLQIAPGEYIRQIQENEAH